MGIHQTTGKPFDPTKRVFVYKNLHKNAFSVRQAGIVVFHCQSIFLRECRYLVQPAGRERVLSEGRKNVHAGVSGFLCSRRMLKRRQIEIGLRPDQYFGYEEVSYDPHMYDGFFYYDGDHHQILARSDYADMMIDDGFGHSSVLAIFESEIETDD